MSYHKIGDKLATQNLSNDHEEIQLDSNNMSSQAYVVADFETPYTHQGSNYGDNEIGNSSQTYQQSAPTTKSSHIFQINYYQQYFDLDTDTFFMKILRALNPLNKSFSATSDENQSTELYGFFWITGTLIFLMFVSATGSNNLHSWIHPGDKDNSGYEYSFDLLSYSIGLFYGYNIAIPLLLYVVTTWLYKFPNVLPLTEMISIYGYTNILWVPITLINLFIAILVSEKHKLFLNLLEWIIVILSGFVTGASNLSKISPLIQKNTLQLAEVNPQIDSKKLHITLMGALVLVHLGFTIVVKVLFFGFKTK